MTQSVTNPHAKMRRGHDCLFLLLVQWHVAKSVNRRDDEIRWRVRWLWEKRETRVHVPTPRAGGIYSDTADTQKDTASSRANYPLP